MARAKVVGIYKRRGDAGAKALFLEAKSKLESAGYKIVEADRARMKGMEAVLVLGGDGTLLSAARLAAKEKIPVLGVNTGGLGFLTEFKKDELDAAIQLIKSGEKKTERRMMLSVDAGRLRESALNDVVIYKSTSAKLIEFVVYVDGHVLGRYRADGLIISTPTGSTAYSLSAGGPIVAPNMDCIIISPICPHTLTNRTVIVCSNCVVEVEPTRAQQGEVFISVDGQGSATLKVGAKARIKKAQHYALRLIAQKRSFFGVLREKLRWQQQ